MKTNPVLITVVLAVLTGLGGALTLLADNMTLEGVIVALATLLTTVAGVLAKSWVTPLADPKVEVDGELVPLAPVSTGWTAPGANVPVERPTPEGGHV